jgi:hypothetical protein
LREISHVVVLNDDKLLDSNVLQCFHWA